MWKPVTIEVSNGGYVRLCGRTISTRRSSRGYLQVAFAVHRLVALAFHGTPPRRGMVVHHIDGDPGNNRAGNLQWCTQQMNTRFGVMTRPKLLSPNQVAGILRRKPAATETLRDLASRFGVSYACILAIRSYRNWSQVGTTSNRAILTERQVAEIRAWKPVAPTAAQLARKYRVSATTIRNIWAGRY
jgi:hypothetical protein